MNTEMTCRRCGAVLAHSIAPDAEGLLVRSPTDCQHALHILPRGRTTLRCVQCGTTREWYPPHRTRRQAAKQGTTTGTQHRRSLPPPA